MPSSNASLISEALLMFIGKKNIVSNIYFINVMSDMSEIYIYIRKFQSTIDFK